MSGYGPDLERGEQVKRYDLTGEKLAYIITYHSKNINGEHIDPHKEKVKKIKNMFNSHGFHVDGQNKMDDNAYDDDIDEEACISMRNLTLLRLTSYVQKIAQKKHNAACIAFYVIAPQAGREIVTNDNKPLPFQQIWEILAELILPKLFFIQALCGSDAGASTTLLNSRSTDGSNYTGTLPRSSNLLLAYLPDYGREDVCVEEILCQELSKPFNINECMTSVNHVMNSKNCQGTPKFASTQHKQLYLKNSNSHEVAGSGPGNYSISERKQCLVFAFLFEIFQDQKKNLSEVMPLVRDKLKTTFNCLGFTVNFCITDGKMRAKGFREKLKEIVSNQEMMKKAECVIIVIFSHGNKNGIIETTYGSFQLSEVCLELCECEHLKGKPKLILVNACRGGHDDKTPPVYVGHSDLQVFPVNRNVQWTHGSSDILWALSSTEGNITIGPFFLSHLCDNLLKYGKQYHMLTLLNFTMEDVGTMEFNDQKKSSTLTDAKQQVTFTSTLCKLLYFPNDENVITEKTHHL